MSKEVLVADIPGDVANTPEDVAAVWELKLPDGNHKVVFEHGNTSGKRVIWVDGEEVATVMHLIDCLKMHIINFNMVITLFIYFSQSSSSLKLPL